MSPIATISNVLKRTIEDPDTGGRRDYYFGSIRSDLAKALTFVPVLEPSKRTFLQERTDEGYQRAGSTARMRRFGKYVEENPLSVVPPVVLSGRGSWKFKGSGPVGALEVQDAAAIIDGQHRMGGYVWLADEEELLREIDFILLADLSVEEEKAEFLDINNTQKGVPKPLTAYLEAADEALVGWELNERSDSPFAGKISRQTMQKGQLFNLNSVAKNVDRAFNHGAFQVLSVDDKVDILTGYWDLIAENFPEEWEDIEKESRRDFEFKLLELTGFIAMSYACPDIVAPAFDPETRTVNWDAVRSRLVGLSESGCVDWTKDGEFSGLTGEVGGRRIHRKIQFCLQQAGQTFDSDGEREHDRG